MAAWPCARRRAARRPAGHGGARRTRAGGRACRPCSVAGTWPPHRPACTCVGACDTSTGRGRAPPGSRGRSAVFAEPSGRRETARATRPRVRPGRVRLRRRGRRGARPELGRQTTSEPTPPPRTAGAGPACRAASRAPRRASSTSPNRCEPVFTRAIRQLNAETSHPTAWQPYTFASTRVVPDPQNGS